MEAIAKLRNLKGSPQKARLVIDLIRGRDVSQALAILKFTNKRAADPIAKCLRSAIANATYSAEQQNVAIDPDDLWVKTCFVDMGPHKNRRRMRPAPQGRAYREQRHYCHITILVTNEDKPEETKKAPKVKPESVDVDETVKTAKATTKKAGEKKETKKAKKEEPKVEEDKSAPEAVELVSQEVNDAEATLESENLKETANEMEAENAADASEAKETTTQRPAELNETQPADEKQEDINEQLERQ